MKRNSRCWTSCIALSAVFSMGAAACCTSPSETYVKADAETYNVVAPRYATYVNADGTLTPEEKARRIRTVETWKLRIEKAGGVVK